MARARRFLRDSGGFLAIPADGRGLHPRVPILSGRRRGRSIPEAVLHVKLQPLNSAKGRERHLGK